MIRRGTLSDGSQWNFLESRGLYHVHDAANNRGYGKTLEEAVLGMEMDRKHEFAPGKEWVGDQLKDRSDGRGEDKGQAGA